MHSKHAVLIAGILLAGCSNHYEKLARSYHFSTQTGAPDYALLENWAAHPYKHDPSDSVPMPLRKGYQPDSSADVFFIHPTTYTAPEKSFGQNAPVADPQLAAKTDYSTILFQASIFNEAGRVFAPRYRQAHYSSYFPKDREDTARAAAAFELAYQDVKAAFLYYLEHDNKGRPIVIAAHSQGTNHGKRLMKELFDGKPLQQKLVAAYLVGMPVEQDYFTSIKPCNAPDQTGCFCSWRTYREGYRPDYIQRENFKAIVTNPLSWKASEPEVNRQANPGSVLMKFNQVLTQRVNARLGEGVLWTDKPRFFGNVFYVSKNYHIADMNLFYVSIRENAKLRVKAFTLSRLSK
jgi:hypothetical protein